MQTNRYLSIPKAQELAAALMADEADGWDFVAVIIDAARGYAIVRVYDDSGAIVGEL